MGKKCKKKIQWRRLSLNELQLPRKDRDGDGDEEEEEGEDGEGSSPYDNNARTSSSYANKENQGGYHHHHHPYHQHYNNRGFHHHRPPFHQPYPYRRGGHHYYIDRRYEGRGPYPRGSRSSSSDGGDKDKGSVEGRPYRYQEKPYYQDKFYGPPRPFRDYYGPEGRRRPFRRMGRPSSFPRSWESWHPRSPSNWGQESGGGGGTQQAQEEEFEYECECEGDTCSCGVESDGGPKVSRPVRTVVINNDGNGLFYAEPGKPPLAGVVMQQAFVGGPLITIPVHWTPFIDPGLIPGETALTPLDPSFTHVIDPKSLPIDPAHILPVQHDANGCPVQVQVKVDENGMPLQIEPSVFTVTLSSLHQQSHPHQHAHHHHHHHQQTSQHQEHLDQLIEQERQLQQQQQLQQRQEELLQEIQWSEEAKEEEKRTKKKKKKKKLREESVVGEGEDIVNCEAQGCTKMEVELEDEEEEEEEEEDEEGRDGVEEDSDDEDDVVVTIPDTLSAAAAAAKAAAEAAAEEVEIKDSTLETSLQAGVCGGTQQVQGASPKCPNTKPRTKRKTLLDRSHQCPLEKTAREAEENSPQTSASAPAEATTYSQRQYPATAEAKGSDEERENEAGDSSDFVDSQYASLSEASSAPESPGEPSDPADPIASSTSSSSSSSPSTSSCSTSSTSCSATPCTTSATPCSAFSTSSSTSSLTPCTTSCCTTEASYRTNTTTSITTVTPTTTPSTHVEGQEDLVVKEEEEMVIVKEEEAKEEEEHAVTHVIEERVDIPLEKEAAIEVVADNEAITVEAEKVTTSEVDMEEEAAAEVDMEKEAPPLEEKQGYVMVPILTPYYDPTVLYGYPVVLPEHQHHHHHHHHHPAPPPHHHHGHHPHHHPGHSGRGFHKKKKKKYLKRRQTDGTAAYLDPDLYTGEPFVAAPAGYVVPLEGQTAFCPVQYVVPPFLQHSHESIGVHHAHAPFVPHEQPAEPVSTSSVAPETISSPSAASTTPSSTTTAASTSTTAAKGSSAVFGDLQETERRQIEEMLQDRAKVGKSDSTESSDSGVSESEETAATELSSDELEAREAAAATAQSASEDLACVDSRSSCSEHSTSSIEQTVIENCSTSATDLDSLEASTELSSSFMTQSSTTTDYVDSSHCDSLYASSDFCSSVMTQSSSSSSDNLESNFTASFVDEKQDQTALNQEVFEEEALDKMEASLSCSRVDVEDKHADGYLSGDSTPPAYAHRQPSPAEETSETLARTAEVADEITLAAETEMTQSRFELTESEVCTEMEMPKVSVSYSESDITVSEIALNTSVAQFNLSENYTNTSEDAMSTAEIEASPAGVLSSTETEFKNEQGRLNSSEVDVDSAKVEAGGTHSGVTPTEAGEANSREIAVQTLGNENSVVCRSLTVSSDREEEEEKESEFVSEEVRQEEQDEVVMNERREAEEEELCLDDSAADDSSERKSPVPYLQSKSQTQEQTLAQTPPSALREMPNSAMEEPSAAAQTLQQVQEPSCETVAEPPRKTDVTTKAVHSVVDLRVTEAVKRWIREVTPEKAFTLSEEVQERLLAQADQFEEDEYFDDKLGGDEGEVSSSDPKNVVGNPFAPSSDVPPGIAAGRSKRVASLALRFRGTTPDIVDEYDGASTISNLSQGRLYSESSPSPSPSLNYSLEEEDLSLGRLNMYDPLACTKYYRLADDPTPVPSTPQVLSREGTPETLIVTSRDDVSECDSEVDTVASTMALEMQRSRQQQQDEYGMSLAAEILKAEKLLSNMTHITGRHDVITNPDVFLQQQQEQQGPSHDHFLSGDDVPCSAYSSGLGSSLASTPAISPTHASPARPSSLAHHPLRHLTAGEGPAPCKTVCCAVM